ncbi:MAG: hypothetical protein RIQ56_524 [Candidatus Parcubacteria bacterium]|jgi:tRNA-specific 2-thiouridylase
MKRVFVGLSGGVDSAVSAALLQERGFNVSGVFIKIWSPEFLECTWREDRLDAMRVAVALNIPFFEIDLSDEYRRSVVDRMTRDYQIGITPNPDVLCNEKIKFGSFATWAYKEGADYVATGHYARVDEVNHEHKLLRGLDSSKDHSYFLHRLDKKDLSRVLFPAGDYTKMEIRKLARKFSLPVANKPDSQGLCFVGHVSMHEFLSRFIELRKGNVVDPFGTVIGEHYGAALYTLGQRHGFELKGTRHQIPHFVTKVDTKQNQITVSSRREDAFTSHFSIRDVHWLEEPKFPLSCSIQCRYREDPVMATVIPDENSLLITPVSAHLASPGQSCVFYRGEQVLGGGVIE